MKKIFITVCMILTGSFALAADTPIQKFVLDSGQTLIIKEVHSNPIVTVDTWIKTGSINEDDRNNGVSHFLEHLFFKGSKNHAPGEFDKILETKGGVTNAATSKDFTHYYITVPSKHFDEALELHADMLLNPLVPRKELERERKVVIEEIAKDENSPNSVVYENLVGMLYTTHPYKRKVIGTKKIIETIHRDDIMSYYNKWYSPSNMVTIIVGDVNTDDILAKVKKEFVQNTRGCEKSVYGKEKPLTEYKREVAYLPTQSGYMLIGFRGVNINDSDAYALDIFATILGDGRTSVFYKNIKDKLRLAFSISATNMTFRDDGIFYISANFTPDKADKLETKIFEEISNIQKDGVTPEQVRLAKNIIERDTYFQRESVSNIAQELGYVAVTSGDIKIYENYVSNIKKVTPQDVKRVAEKYLGKNKAAVSLVLPPDKKEVKVSNTTAVSVDFQPPVSVSEKDGTQKYLLSNGATLLFTQNPTNEIVAVSIEVKGGNFLETKHGVANMVASTMMKGTKNYSKHELDEILEDNGIKISPSTRSDAFQITLLTTTPEYSKALGLLSEIVNNAIFPEFEIDKVKTDKLNSIAKSRDIPLNLALEGYKNAIFENTPYSNSLAELEKNLPTISKSDIETYYSKVFNPKNIVISVNGNVSKDDTIKAFSTMFNSTSSAAAFTYDNKISEIKPVTSPRITEKQVKETNTDWIFMGWQTAGIENTKEFATLHVIDSILGTGMSSRLFKNLRDSEGLAYQLGSSYSANVLRGAFLVYIGTNPETYDKALNGLKTEINRLKTEFVGTKELQDAKEKLLGHFILSRETNLDKASVIAWFELCGKGYDFTKEYEDAINSVTENDIMQVANKYFGSSNYVLSSVKK